MSEFVARKGFVSLGGITFPVTEVTTTYSITQSDYLVECTGSSSFTVTLPTAVGIEGQIFGIKNSGSGTITVNTTSSQTIDGVTSITLGPKDYLQISSSGARWMIY